MRNLRKFRHEEFPADSEFTGACWDASTDEVVISHGPTESKADIELLRVTGYASCDPFTSRLIARWPVPSPRPDVPVDRIVSLHHFGGSLSTCVVLAGGDIVLVQEDEDPGRDAHIEIVGSVDADITAARWSPDEELLCITTSADTMVLMSRTFDGIGEAAMTKEDLRLSKHVSVGWGKKETQFRGKGAKALRDPTIPEKVDEGLASSYEDGRTTISWRGDGAYVAVNSEQGGSRRAIRVYTRDAVLDSVSEPVDGLEGAVSWRPAGNLIAGLQRWNGANRVVFFERNGLRHGEFDVRLPKESLEDEGKGSQSRRISLAWNIDSSVLAVTGSGFTQLWTMGNYHWYLKQELPARRSNPLLSWHPEKALVLATATSGLFATDTAGAVDLETGQQPWAKGLTCHEFIFTVARGSVIPPNDAGAVAVVDGSTVKITPFHQANVPPPMALYEIDVGQSVVDVAFDGSNSQVVVLCQNSICLFRWPSAHGRLKEPQLISTQKLKQHGAEASRGPASQVCFVNSELLGVLYLGGSTTVISFYQAGDQPSQQSLQYRSQVALPGLLSMGSVGGIGSVGFCQDTKRGFLTGLGQDIVPRTRLPQQFPWLEAHFVAEENAAVPIGLARNGSLYAGARLLEKNCTSFLVTADHIVYTTTSSLLKFIHLQAVMDMEVPPDEPETDERCRSIERGARLVTAMPSKMSVVLQMPRGNLETIYPRAMVVAGIRKLIEARAYGKAFSVCRTQRVDMNLLCDYRHSAFLANVGLFLDELGDTTYVDLFLSSLRNEDVTSILYRDTKRASSTEDGPGVQTDQPSPERDPAPGSKVNRVCQAVLKELQVRNPPNLQNIITANLCMDPPALDDALSVAAKILSEEGEERAEKVVEHICFLADVNKAYDHALGLYNLELTALVAQQSQQDPREYLPFVQSLSRLPELRRRFAIDDHLGRWEKAVVHLKDADAFDEFCAYMNKHKLYQSALRLYRYDEARVRTLTGLYADHLESTSDFRQAGLTYESLRNYTRASRCYRAAGPSCWRECLAAAAMQQDPPMRPAALTDLAIALADAVLEARDYQAASTIQLAYLSQPAEAVRSLCKGHHFAEAIRIAVTTTEPADQDLLSTVLDPGLLEALSSSTEFLADCRGQLQAQVPRVLELRRRALEDPLAFYEGERPARTGGGDEDDSLLLLLPDNVSVVSDAASRISTSASLFTRYTGKGEGGGGGSVGTLASNVSRASSKNRKRAEKKRARGRKGTVYEEEYLVNSVRRLVERVGAAKEEVERMVVALVRRGMAERARAVEGLMVEVLDGCRQAVETLWPGPRVDVKGQKKTFLNGDGAGHTTRQEGLLDEQRPPSPPSPPPVVPSFAKLSLLG